MLQNDILNHPHLSFGQKPDLSKALVNAVAGTSVPTRSEIVLFQHVFGKETATGLDEIATSSSRTCC